MKRPFQFFFLSTVMLPNRKMRTPLRQSKNRVDRKSASCKGLSSLKCCDGMVAIFLPTTGLSLPKMPAKFSHSTSVTIASIYGSPVKKSGIHGFSYPSVGRTGGVVVFPAVRDSFASTRRERPVTAPTRDEGPPPQHPTTLRERRPEYCTTPKLSYGSSR